MLLVMHANPAGDVRCQEECLKRMPECLESSDYTAIKGELVPRMHALCLRTTSAAVRVNALVCMGKVAGRLDKEEAMKFLATAGQVGVAWGAECRLQWREDLPGCRS